MERAHRTQIDGKQDTVSAAAGLDYSKEPTKVREEFADEQDVNNILARLGHQGPEALNQRNGIYGEVNWDLDLQAATIAAQEARDAYHRLPKELKELYPDMASLLNAVEADQLTTEETTSGTTTTETTNQQSVSGSTTSGGSSAGS